jgi:hypothetical protein
LSDFLVNGDYDQQDYLSKNHFGHRKQRDLILSHDRVLVLDITRNVRDAVVSAYYHFRRKEHLTADFATFYWRWGRILASNIITYHNVWDLHHSRVYVSSYEALKVDFSAEAQRIGCFLGFDLSPEDIRSIREETHLSRLRDRYGEHERDFFRKGIVGDWRNHFTPAMVEDIARIEERGLGTWENALLAMLKRLRLYRGYRRRQLGRTH